MLLSQMAAEAAKDYKYDIILANVNGKLQRYQIWI